MCVDSVTSLSLRFATCAGRCMRLPEEINVNELVSITKNTFTTTGTIDDPSNLASARVWLLRWESLCFFSFFYCEHFL